MSNKTGRRFFLCTGEAVTADQLSAFPNSHIIGELRYVFDEGHRVTALARWDVSVRTCDEPPIKPDVDVYIIGDARDIKCRHVEKIGSEKKRCENKERWEIGQGALLQLMSRYGKLTARDI